MCPPSVALPQIFDGNESEAKDKGSAVHKFLERVAAVGYAPALAEVDKKYADRCASINVAKLAMHLKLSTEIAVAYNWREDTARILTPVAPRVYEIDPECEIAATMDLGAYDPKQSRVYVGDYKGPRAWLPKPDQSMQLAIAAVCLARIYGATEAVLEYIRILDDGEPFRFDATLDVFGIEAAAARIRETMETVERVRVELDAGRIPNVTEGPWCRYCPAKMHCPAKTAGMRALLVGEKKISLREPITPDNATQFYTMVRAAKDLLAQAEAAAYAYAKLTPIKVRDEEDGSVRFFGELSRPGNDVLDGSKAHLVIAKRYGAEAANAAVTMDVSKKAIGDAIKAHKAPEVTQKSEMESILSEIEALGGISNPTTTTTTEYVVSPTGEAKAKRRSAA